MTSAAVSSLENEDKGRQLGSLTWLREGRVSFPFFAMERGLLEILPNELITNILAILNHRDLASCTQVRLSSILL